MEAFVDYCGSFIEGCGGVGGDMKKYGSGVYGYFDHAPTPNSSPIKVCLTEELPEFVDYLSEVFDVVRLSEAAMLVLSGSDATPV